MEANASEVWGGKDKIYWKKEDNEEDEDENDEEEDQN